VFHDVNGTAGVFRRFLRHVPTLDSIGMPDAVADLVALDRGLVVVTGAAGSGRSTTTAALVDLINTHRAAHVVTLEHPVEVLHAPKRSLVNQRAVGEQPGDLVRALRAAGREDADVVVIGDVSDPDVLKAALDLADSGRLVIAQSSSPTATSCIERLLDRAPLDRQDTLRALLADNLKGVIAQTLCKKVGGGRVAAVEVLTVTSAMAALIKTGQTHQLPQAMAASKGPLVICLNDALRDLVGMGVVSRDEAARRAVDKAEFRGGLKAVA
jgi:twitching motility protein PilT